MKIMLQLPYALRSNPRLAPLQARAHAHTQELVAIGQKLGCVRTDIPAERLVTLWEAIDAELDRSLIGTNQAPTQALLENHIKLAFDLCYRVMAANPAAPPGMEKKP
jgi:hypothetical protein